MFGLTGSGSSGDLLPRPFSSLARPCKDGPIPLSFQQRGLWLMHQLEGGTLAYSDPFAYHLKGPLQVAILEQSWNEVIRRHESLRTTFTIVDGQPAAVITPELLIKLPVVDLRQLAEGEREAETRRLMNEWARRPFDLTVGPLLRGTLFQNGDEDYVLVFDAHHIVFDGWSLSLWVSEQSAIYNALIEGRGSSLTRLSTQYADFVHWQREFLEDSIREEQLEYWSNQLRGVEPLSLIADHPRPPYQTYKGKTRYWKLKKDVSHSLRALCHRQNISIFRMLTAAWQTLLHRYSGLDDIVVGCPFGNRSHPEFKKVIGFFINTLPIRTNFSGDPSFLEILHRLRDAIRGALANQDVPFGKIVEQLSSDRDRSHHPFYQVMIVQRKFAWQMPRLLGIEATALPLENGTAKFDLSLYTYDDCEEVRGYLEYNADLFEDPTADRMLGHFENLLETVANDPQQTVSSIPFLAPGERQNMLVDWNATAMDYDHESCVHQHFEAQVKRSPDAIALEFEGQGLHYRDLNARANQLAHYLRKCGVETESLVGIFLERSLEMVVGLLAILKAGAAYVPMDPSYPVQRLELMVEDAKPLVILTHKGLLSNLPPNDAKLVCLDSDWNMIGKESDENPPLACTSANLAYTIFTSGSTGRPKGVEILHRGVVNVIESMRRQLQFGNQDILLAITSLSFDISYLEILMPLVAGGKVVVISRAAAIDGKGIAGLLADSHATFMQATPATWHLLLESGWRGSADLTVLCGGEALTRELADRMLERVKVVWNLYGPTETTIWSTAHRVLSGSGSVSIGRPIANTQLYILDDRSQPVPPGVPGELLIGGDGVARGYLARSDLTEQKFIPDPFSLRPDARLYRTGDLARWRPDGTIDCLGRLDRQVKIRGFRIELEEIESVLRQGSNVLDVAVVVRDDIRPNNCLTAYVVPVKGTHPTAPEMAMLLKQKLPDYMIPSAFVIMESLPRTPNGKLDRRSLPVPEYQSTQDVERSVAPHDDVEWRLAKIWQKILGLESIGVTADFFSLGGHSVLGAQMLMEVEKEFGKSLPFSALFQGSTIEQLASLVREKGWTPPLIVPIQARGTKPPFFAVYARVGYLELSNKLGPDQPFFVLPYENLFNKKTARSLRDIAKDLAGRMRALQPKGPYYLGGMCLAGIVAFAIAVELHDQGQEVALLALMDAPAPGYRQRPSRRARLENFFAAHVTFHARNLIQLSFREKRAYVSLFTTDVLWHFKVRSWRLAYKTYQKMGLTLPHSLRNPFHLMGQAALGYEPPSSYPGRVTLFRPATRPNGRWQDYALGWGELAAGGVEVYSVPGVHSDLLVLPQVAHLSRQLKHCLAEAQAQAAITEKRQTRRTDGNRQGMFNPSL